MSTVSSIVPRDTGTVDADNPWPGLASFREDDRAFFRGRESEIEELHRLVRRERLTVVFGHSGLGKTSLLQAGLFPRLREDGAFPVYIRLDHTRSGAPLREQVEGAILSQARAAEVEPPAPGVGETLWEYFSREDSVFWSRRNRPVLPVLVFDQFEEIFTLGKETPDRAAASTDLLVELGDLVEGRPPAAVAARLEADPSEAARFTFSRQHYKVLLTLREDFLAELEALRDRIPSIGHNRMRLRRMTGEQATDVVGQTEGRLVAGDAVEPIVRFVAGPTAEGKPLHDVSVDPALLSVFCRELNNKRAQLGQPRITTALLEGSWAEILTDFYEHGLADQPPEVRTFIEENLLTVSGFRDSVALENALTTPGVTEPAIRTLVDRRLLRLEELAGIRRLELAHDVLTDVVRSSRDTRREREERAAAERARLAAEERERHMQTELRRSRRTSVLLAGLALLAIAGAAWGFVAQRQASRAQIEAQGALADAVEARQQSERARADAELARQATERALSAQQTATLVAEQARADAERAQARTELALGDAQTARRQTEVALADADFRDALALLERDQAHAALAHLARAARIDPDNLGVRTRLLSTLLERNWSTPLVAIRADYGMFAVLSPDGERIFTNGYNSGGRIWDARTGRPLTGILNHAAAVNSGTFSPDGRRLVTMAGRRVTVWDAASGEALGSVNLPESSLERVIFDPDGERILTVSNDGARIWHGDGTITLEGHGSFTVDADFSPDGQRVVTASWDSTARVWDSRSGQPVGEPLRHPRDVDMARFSPDGSRIITAARDGAARLWDAGTGQPIGQPMPHAVDRGLIGRFGRKINDAAFSPDGGRVVTASRDSTARIWDAHTGQPIGELRHAAAVITGMFSPDGHRIVTGSEDGTARIWDGHTATAISEPMRHVGRVTAAFTPDGQRVVTGSTRTVQIWDVRTGAMHHLSTPSRLSSSDRERIWEGRAASAGEWVVRVADDTARVWDLRTGNPIGEPLRHRTEITIVRFSPDGERVLTGSADGVVRVWTAATGEPVGVPLENAIRPAPAAREGYAWLTHATQLRSPSFSPDGHRVLITSGSATHLRDVRTGQPIGERMQHTGSIVAAHFSPDGRRVLTASQDNTAGLWDAETGRPLTGPLRHSRWLQFAGFSPDGTRVVTTSTDNTARVWDAVTGEPLGEPLRHEDYVNTAAFSSDGETVVTTSNDRTARVWDVESGMALGEPLRHTGTVNMAVFSPDGQRVVTGSADRTARVWSTFSSRELTAPLRHDGAVLSVAFSQNGQQVITRTGSETRTWDVPFGSADHVQALARLAEGIGGYRLTETGTIVSLASSTAVLDSLHRAFADAPDGDGSTASLIEWILADRSTRTISPFSKVTVPEYILRRPDEEGESACGELRRAFPGHPALRAQCQ